MRATESRLYFSHSFSLIFIFYLRLFLTVFFLTQTPMPCPIPDEPAAKCEDNWFNSFDQACTYMESVKINFGDVDETEYSSGGSGVTATAGVFTATTVGLAAYVYYLKGKVDSSQINLGN